MHSPSSRVLVTMVTQHTNMDSHSVCVLLPWSDGCLKYTHAFSVFVFCYHGNLTHIHPPSACVPLPWLPHIQPRTLLLLVHITLEISLDLLQQWGTDALWDEQFLLARDTILLGEHSQRTEVLGRVHTVKPILRDHCHERPPVLKDHIFLAEGPTFQYNWICHQRPPVLQDQWCGQWGAFKIDSTV